MIKKQALVYSMLAFLILFTSCGEYQNALKSDDTSVKYTLAEKYYNEGDYKRALRLLEQIVPQFVGKPQGERVIYFYADSYYKSKDYLLASYQFERFSKSYPRSDKAEEAAFYGAKSYYHLSPKHSIDQTETYKGIEALQTYINSYPSSERVSEANKLVQELTQKLERKAYEIGKQFNKLSDHYSAIKSLELFISDNPGTIYKEDAMFYKLDSSYKLAVNSVQSKKEERLKDAKAAYNSLINSFAESKYLDQATAINNVIESQLKQFSK